MKYIIKLCFSILIILLVTIFQFCRKEEIKKIIKVTTGEISGITTNSAIAKGDVVDVVGGTLQYGHCWSTSQKPTYDNEKTILYTEEIPGIFTSSLTGLFPGTTYYIRAFAYEVNDKNGDGINDGIIVYGNEKNFKTEDQTLATIITGNVSEITPNTAKITSIISNPGSGVDSVLQHGHCWSTSQEPTISNNKTELGSRNSTGEFTSDITGLQKDIKYYVRAYATSEVGTAYGNEISFTTYTRVPAIFTLPISSITGNSAESGGNIIDNGGAEITTRGVCWSTSQNPTILDNITLDDSGIGSFTSLITGLSRGTIYYVRAYATSSICTAYGNEINFTSLYETGAVTDYDGNEYNTVQIGNQWWMAENLKTTKYNDGTTIPLVTDNTAWSNLTTPGYCWYYNDSVTYAPDYGALYNWHTVETGNLCPTGWHVPTDSELTTLTDYLGGESVAGGKLKETGITHWNSPNTGATNESGFTALPGGNRSGSGAFYGIGGYDNWWSSTEHSSTTAWGRYIYYDTSPVHRANYGKECGFSVRCVRDD